VDQLTQSVEEYLESVFKLTHEHGAATVGKLAEELRVAPSSVSEMLGRLRGAGLACGSKTAGIGLAQRAGRAVFNALRSYGHGHRACGRFFWYSGRR